MPDVSNQSYGPGLQIRASDALEKTIELPCPGVTKTSKAVLIFTVLLSLLMLAPFCGHWGCRWRSVTLGVAMRVGFHHVVVFRL